MNDKVSFVIEEGIALPPRTIPNAGPRESMYPIDKMQKGQAFAVQLGQTDEAGNFTPYAVGSEEASEAARRKQSQFSSLARSRNVSLVTRFFSGAEGHESPFANTPAPCLGVWHDGPAKEKKPRKKKGEAAQTGTEGNADAGAGTAGEASATAGDALVL